MNKLIALTLYQFKLQTRNPLGMFYIIFFPVFLLFANMKYFDNTEYLLASLSLFVVMVTVISNFGGTFVKYKELNFFLKYRLLGFKPLGVATALFATALIFQFIGLAIMVGVAMITLGIHFPVENLHNVLIILLVINTFELALIFFASSVLKEGEKYQMGVLAISFCQWFLGISPPEFVATETGNKLMAIFNPIVHGNRALMGIWGDGKSVYHFQKEILILLGVSVVLFTIGTRYFTWYDLKK